MATSSREAARWFIWICIFQAVLPSCATENGASLAIVRDCYVNCTSLYERLYNTSLAAPALENYVLAMHCDAIAAGDAACSAVDDVYSCYRLCDAISTQYFVTYSTTEEYQATEQLHNVFCLTGESKCRAMDAYYCQAAYNYRLCDNNLDMYIKCVTAVEQARGCMVATDFSCSSSQLVVQSLILSSIKYCAMAPVTDLVSDNPGDGGYAALQACQVVIDELCLIGLTGTDSAFATYFHNNASCGAFLDAISCIYSTLNTTLAIGSQLYVAPCKLLPNAQQVLGSLTNQLRKMMPAACTHNTCSNEKFSSSTNTTATLAASPLCLGIKAPTTVRSELSGTTTAGSARMSLDIQILLTASLALLY